MAYRNGTYVAFNANNTTDFTKSDIKYYNLLKAWHVREENDFNFVNSHDKTNAVRDTSKKETLRRTLITRMNKSKNLILIISDITRFDNDWVPFEIAYAIDNCEIPIIATYVDYKYITNPKALSQLWPASLRIRIEIGSADIIHIPFKLEPLTDAVSQFDHNNPPKGGSLGIYDAQTYYKWGLMEYEEFLRIEPK